MLPEHIPYLLEILEPVWTFWELFATALTVESTKLDWLKSNPKAAMYLEQLLRVIREFGKITPFKQRTWEKIYVAVKKLDHHAADQLKEGHPILNELCKCLYHDPNNYVYNSSATF